MKNGNGNGMYPYDLDSRLDSVETDTAVVKEQVKGLRHDFEHHRAEIVHPMREDVKTVLQGVNDLKVQLASQSRVDWAKIITTVLGSGGALWAVLELIGK